MGHGIGQLYATNGRNVVLYDLNDEALNHAKTMITNSLSVMVAKEILTEDQKKHALNRISYSTSLQDAVVNADMVVEVVPEKLALKHQVYAQIEDIVSPDTIITSNTSALPLTELVIGAKHPDRFLITHYFAPAQLIPLVEIIQMNGVTRPEILEGIRDFLVECGKSPIVLKKEVPGFIANRMQMALIREALWILEHGVATAADIDTVLKDSLGFRYVFLGPLEGQDIAGIGTTYHVGETLYPLLSDAKVNPAFLKEMIDNNQVGLRTKKGFYEYPDNLAEEKLLKRDDNFLEVYKLRKKQLGR